MTKMLKPYHSVTILLAKDEMSKYIKTQPVEKLNSAGVRVTSCIFLLHNIFTNLTNLPCLKKLSVQMDESTLRNSEALLLTYLRYIDKR